MSFLLSKNRYRSLLYVRLGIGACLMLSVLLTFSVYERYRVKQETSDRRAETEEERSALEERKEMIEHKVDYLSREEGVEAEIRKHFDVAREGEQVIVLVGEEKKDDTAALPLVQDEDEERPFWLRWFSW